MSDVFHNQVPDGFLMDVWRIMGLASQHTFLLLTKRPERMYNWLAKWANTAEADPDPQLARGPAQVRAVHRSGRSQLFADMIESWGEPPDDVAYPSYDWMGGMRWWPQVLPNVWLGVSAEDQKNADRRIPVLLQTPAAVRFVSAEPLLGTIRLRLEWFGHSLMGHSETGPEEFGVASRWVPGIDWLICGAESGPGARPMNDDWVRDLRDQCVASRAPFFLKQKLDDRGHKVSLPKVDGQVWAQWPETP